MANELMTNSECIGLSGGGEKRLKFHVTYILFWLLFLKKNVQETGLSITWCSVPLKSYKFLMLPPYKHSTLKCLHKGRGGKDTDDLEEIKDLYLSKPQDTVHSHFHLTIKK